MEHIPIPRMGEFLLISVQVDMHDRLALKLQEDLTAKIVAYRILVPPRAALQAGRLLGLDNETMARPESVAVKLFLRLMRSQPPGKTISTADLVTHLHGPMHVTRGAAVTLVRVEPERLAVTFCGVGKISGSLMAPNGETRGMISHNGTLGHQMERVQEFSYAWQRGSLMVLLTDGVHTSWKREETPGPARQASATIADAIYRDAWRGRDDATVLVASLA